MKLQLERYLQGCWEVSRLGIGEKMKVLYYTWNENSYQGCLDAMNHQGWQVDVIAGKISNYDYDEKFVEALVCQLKSGYDFIFTFDYFPVISRVAMEMCVPYISWVYDMPHWTLESETLQNPCNCVFVFDRRMVERYLGKGIDTVHYMPLPVNVRKYDAITKQRPTGYQHDISFVGSLYNDDNNFFDQIRGLPEELRGFIDGTIEAQLQIYGYDIIGEVFNTAKCDELARYAQVDLGPLYDNCRDEIFCDMIRKKATVVERRRLLEKISGEHPLDLYAPVKPEGILAKYCGYADYEQEMPVIFATSKINLNITLRSIQSGIPLRVMDILGAGGFALTNYQLELPEYFVSGKDLVWYEGQEDMMAKIAFYLTHDTQREKIAASGYEQAKKIFSYDVLLEKLIQYL